MADCNDLFQEFLAKIIVSKEQRENLQKGKDAIRQDIGRYFSDELKVKQPQFFLQGSYALRTMVRPLGKQDYDLDDGVYLQHTDDDISNPTPATVSNWIMTAVKDHTKQAPKNLKNCVRVVYADDYHIDLPVYREIKGKIHLGTLDGDEWVPSDAKAFNDLFYQRLEKTEQMRSCIKYFKAWKDFASCDLKGIHLTVLVGLNHVSLGERDDRSLVETVRKIIDYLKKEKTIWNPIDKTENLIEDWSVGKIAAAIDDLEKLYEESLKAIETEDKKEASEIWRSIFGERFKRLQERKGRIKPDHREVQPVRSWGI